MQLTIPTTVEEYVSMDSGDSKPHVAVSRDCEGGIPRWIGVDSSGACESFDTLDGAILFAVGFLDARGDHGEIHRALYDRQGSAMQWFAEMLRRFENELENPKKIQTIW